MPRISSVPSIDAYLNDIAYTARQAAETNNLVARRLCIRVLCAQSELLADLALEMDMKVNPLTKDGHSFDFA